MPKVNERTNADGSTSYFVRGRTAEGKQSSEVFPAKRPAEAFAARANRIGFAAAVAERNRRDRAQVEDYIPTLAEWLPAYIRELPAATDRTRLDYAAMARRTFLPALGDLALDGITRADVSAVVQNLSRRLSQKSVANAVHGLLTPALDAAVLAGHIDSNPAYKMRLPRTIRQAEARFLTGSEYDRLMEALEPRWRPLVAFLFGSGLRWSEATALQVHHISDGQPAQVRVRRAWKSTPGQGLAIGPPKSEKSNRDALVSEEAMGYVRPLLDRPADALLFTGARGALVHHGAFRDRFWVPAALKAGLATRRAPYDGPRIHDARHTHASWLLSTGQVTIEQVQDQLGHESDRTTRKIYAHLLPETRNRLAAALNAPRAPQLEG